MPASAFAAAAAAFANPFQELMAAASPTTPYVQEYRILENRFYETGDSIDLYTEDISDMGYWLGVSWNVAADAYGTFESASYVQVAGEEQWLVSNPTVFGEIMGEVSVTAHIFQVAYTLSFKATVLKVSPFDMIAAINMTSPGGWCRKAGGYRDSLYIEAAVSESATECFWGVLGD
jgi:hypothetical protein